MMDCGTPCGAICVVLCIVSCPLVTDAVSWQTPVSFKESQYIATRGHYEWPESVFICERAGGYLAHIDSADEHEFVRGYLSELGEKYVWIGLYTNGYPSTVSGYKWVGGTGSVPFTKWAQNQPDDSNNDEWCVYMRKSYGWRWDNTDCDWNLTILCEIPQ